jgi:3,4-dihydroxy 2-butanone 4-phosphate synthase/GTP cyclohydrolase II
MRAGHTEAGCDLADLAGLTPASVICEIMKDDGTMARLPDLMEFAKEHNLKIGTIADLIHYRSQNECIVDRVGQRRMHTAFGEFDAVVYRDKPSGSAHLALIHGIFRQNPKHWCACISRYRFWTCWMHTPPRIPGMSQRRCRLCRQHRPA